MSVGADSTIAPIFAGALALLARAGSPHYAADGGGARADGRAHSRRGRRPRLGFIADLLSIPVTTGFLAGIAGHIIVVQAPALLGVAPPAGRWSTSRRARWRGSARPIRRRSRIGLGVLAIILSANA